MGELRLSRFTDDRKNEVIDSWSKKVSDSVVPHGEITSEEPYRIKET